MRRTKTMRIGGIAALTLAVAGCSGSVSKSDFTAEFTKAATSEDSPFTKEQATCMGDKIYDEVGEDKITELNDELAGSDEFPKELIAPVAKAGPECVPAGDLLKDELTASGITPEQADCIASGINDDKALNQQVWDAIAASAAGDQSKADDLQGAITDMATKCVGG